ncbi:MAG: metalloprotease PmbA [Nevskiales bacterium]
MLGEELPAANTLAPVLERALNLAKAQGASAAEAALGVSRALTVNVRKGEPETIEFQADRDLSVSVYFGQRRGSATTADLAPAAVAEAVETACAIARHTGADPYAGLAPAERMARTFPELALDHPWPLSVEQAIELARNCEAAGLAADARIANSEGAGLDTRRGMSLYANSHGFLGSSRGSEHSLSCALIAQQGEAMQRDYWYTAARRAGVLESAAEVGRIAARRACARLDPRPLATCTAPVLFPAELARGLFRSFVGAISGGALYRKASFLLDQLGKPVFAAQVQLSQRPLLPEAIGSAAFDHEGVATVDRELIKDGVLQGWVLDSYSARRLGLETTGNSGGVFNLVIEPGRQSFDGLVREMGRGLVVNELMGSGANLITGDYSRGASGFWVENGAIAYPVENITIAGNLREMYKKIALLGNDVDVRGNIRSPSILIDGMTIAGQ